MQFFCTRFSNLGPAATGPYSHQSVMPHHGALFIRSRSRLQNGRQMKGGFKKRQIEQHRPSEKFIFKQNGTTSRQLNRFSKRMHINRIHIKMQISVTKAQPREFENARHGTDCGFNSWPGFTYTPRVRIAYKNSSPSRILRVQVTYNWKVVFEEQTKPSTAEEGTTKLCF